VIRIENLRKKKLIEPGIQLRFFALFLATVCVAALVQTIVLGYVLREVAARLPHDGEAVAERIPGALALGMGATLVLLAPVTLALGVRTTFPIVGPLYRIRQHLGLVVAGERPGPCRIRKGDELQELCALLNRALEPVQCAGSEPERPSDASRSAA